MSAALRTARVFALVVGAGALGGIALPVLVAGRLPAGGPALGPRSVALTLQAAPQPTAEPVSAAELRAIGLLRRAAVAGRDSAYSGTQYVTSWSASGTSSVIVDLQHLPGHGVLARLSGAHQTPTVDDPGAADLDPRALALLEQHYALSVSTLLSQCAGRPAQVVEARQRGGSRVAGRFWVDRANGLLLRRELYDSAGRTVRAAAFVDVDMSVPRPWAGPSRGGGNGQGTSLGADDLADLLHNGWQAPGRLAGGLELLDARTHDGVLHLSYTDGLFALSVFSQPGRLDPESVKGWQAVRLAGRPAWARPGLSQRVVWSGGGWVHTAVADAPDSVVSAAVAAFAAAPRESLRHRIGRGLDRMGSWVDPTS
ncbi:MAG: sigma-E factor regulatory protein RseB domain-containing protein [Pseudonocardiales bacterium]